MRRDEDTGEDSPPRLTDANFWTARCCVMLTNAFVMILGIAVALFWASQGFTDGLR